MFFATKNDELRAERSESQRYATASRLYLASDASGANRLPWHLGSIPFNVSEVLWPPETPKARWVATGTIRECGDDVVSQAGKNTTHVFFVLGKMDAIEFIVIEDDGLICFLRRRSRQVWETIIAPVEQFVFQRHPLHTSSLVIVPYQYFLALFESV